MDKKTSDAQIKAVSKYNKANTIQYAFRCNTKTDEDVIKRLEDIPNVAGYIKSLIRADIAKD